jgi:hypothetical protein
LKTSTRGLPVTWRQMRSSQRLASVAVSENCQSGMPKRRPCALVQLARARMRFGKAGPLSVEEGADARDHAWLGSGSSGRTADIRSARRCCQTVSSMTASVNRKIIEAIT